MKKIIIGLFVSILTLSSCERDITSLNNDPKNPTEVNPDYIFTSAEVGLVFYLTTPSVNYNNFRLFTQQTTETQYTDEAKYNLVKRSMPDNFWTAMYSQLNKLENAKRMINAQSLDANVKANKLATIEALEIYIFSVLVDTYGDIPYTQALDIDKYPTPKYDDAFTIYKNLISRIDAVLLKINTTASAFSGDPIFGGSTSKLKVFLNTLKLRLGINLSDVSDASALAKATVESAVLGGVISSNADNIGLTFDKDGYYSSPIYQEMVSSGRNDYVAANTLVNVMNASNDPRRASFFTTVGGVYKGGIYGSVNTYSSFSHVNDNILIPTFRANLFEYAEVKFILAEAVERGYAVGGTAQQHFEAGISASMDAWGVSAADKAAYLAANNYTALPGTWKQKIGNEAWIATYNRGFESWSFSRRLDFRTFVKPSTYAVPTRLPYPVKEGSVNNTNRLESVVRQWGSASSDVQGSKIFWDKY